MAWIPRHLCADATLLSGAVSLGYDSHPAQSRDGPELAFSRDSLDLSRRVPWQASRLGLSVGGWYPDYEADNDSYRLTLRSDRSHDLWEGMGLLRLGLEGAAYRDALVPADARDELAFSARFARILGARATVGLTAEARRLDDRNASLPWAGRPGASPSRQGRGQGPGAPP
ncbi:hypothetical protein [Thiorhodococcus minor]|uniref:Uncharacterized protein n=1 Tax=Thiorhodococcus minor TaxID=57489 RepID=A0A6M0K5H8_9GAMM|nr:hypothetical protein [Thiorhodococcus minor]NEV64551.1 hypothetical protein [Thiorhodococcus minor]